MTVLKSIFHYTDYRTYLSDFYKSKKSESGYSYSLFAKQAELGSANYLTLVISGKRDLTISNIHQFAKPLKLNSAEFDYFEALVLLNQAGSEEEAKFYDRRRKKIIQTKSKTEKKLPNSILQDWHHTAVLVLAHGHSPEDATEKCAQLLNLKKTVIAQSLTELQNIGLLVADEKNIFRISSPQTTISDPKNLNLLQERYLQGQINQSQHAFAKSYAKQKGKFLSHTLTIPENGIELIHQKLIAVVEEMTTEMDQLCGPADCKVGQINIQIFNPKSFT